VIPILAACAPGASLTIPPLVDGVGTVVFLEIPDPRSADGVRGYASPATALLATSDAIDLTHPTALLLYRAAPEALGYPTSLFVHDAAARGRLRVPDAVARMTGDAWAADPSLLDSPAVIDLRIASELRCLDPGACFVDGLCQPDCGPVAEVAPPLPPAPIINTCLRGVTSTTATVNGQTLRYCVAPRVQPCPGNTLRAIVDGTCVHVGRDCPADAWSDPPEDREIAWIASGAAGGGDGTRGAPWTFAEGLRDASDGAVLMLDRGAHVGAQPIARPLTLQGACVDETLVRGATLMISSSVAIDGLSLLGRAQVSSGGSAMIEGAYLGGADVETGGSLSIHRGLVLGGVVRGSVTLLESESRRLLSAEGGTISLEGSVADALAASAEGAIEARESRISGRTTGMVSLDQGRAHFVDTVIRMTGTGTAISAVGGESRLNLERVTISGAAYGVFVASQAVAVIDVEDAVFEGASSGMALRGPVTLGGRRIAFIDSNAGLDGELSDSAISIDDLFVARLIRHGIRAGGSRLDLHRVSMERPGLYGVRAHAQVRSTGRDAMTLNLDDVLMTGARLRAVSINGAAGANVKGQLHRLAFERGLGTGLSVNSGEATVEVEDLRVSGVDQVEENVRESDCPFVIGCYGSGMAIQPDFGPRADITVRRFRFEGCATTGIEVGSPIELQMSEGVVRDGPLGITYDTAGDWRDLLDRVRFDTTVTALEQAP